MAIPIEDLKSLAEHSEKDAWQFIVQKILDIASKELAQDGVFSQVGQREDEISEYDMFLSSCAWEMWRCFGDCVPKTSDRLAEFWAGPCDGKAILILDAMSLRELPLLIQGAKARGFALHSIEATGAETPSETDPFASALGYRSRSQLQNNQGKSDRFQGAFTIEGDLNFADCKDQVGQGLGIIFWHQWPDCAIHKNYSKKNKGPELLTKEAAATLRGDDFWALVAKLAKGRRLVITSDHGYANAGLFPEAAEGENGWLQNNLSGGRSAKADSADGAAPSPPFLPPVALRIKNSHGDNLVALGRRRWTVSGGYPFLVHGGLSLLEMLCPYIELGGGGN